MTTTPADWRAGGGPDLADFVDGAFEVVTLEPGHLVVRRESVLPDGPRVEVTKELWLGRDPTDPTLRLSVGFEHRGGPSPAARIGNQWATPLLRRGREPAASLSGDRG